jgi:flagellar biosynthesis protein FlhG
MYKIRIAEKEEEPMHIIPIASGKGGVGKSLIAANLSIALAQAGKKVILVDADLGGSNLHMFLGLQSIKNGIGTYLSNEKSSFRDLIIHTGYQNLDFIPGDAEIPGTANLLPAQKNKLIKNLTLLKTDYLILDLAAGTNFNVIDFFLIGGRGIIVTMPTLTATLNAYLFLKNALFRILYSLISKNSPVQNFLEELKKQGDGLQKIYLPKLLATIKSLDKKVYTAYTKKIKQFHPRLILNLLENQKDASIAERLRRSVKEYLGIDLEHLGIMYRDEMQDIALNSRLPLLVYKPQSILSQAIYRIADKLTQYTDDEEQLLDISHFDESFQIASLEAEIDFQERLRYIQELMQSNSLDTGDFIDIIKSQHIQIEKLKKENQLLKTKLSKAVREGFKP